MNPSSLVALIDEKTDNHWGEIGKVERISAGHRIHKEYGTQEPCLLVYLVVSSGDNGWWPIPHNNTHYRYGFHPSPQFFCRYPAMPDCPAAERMLSASLGPLDFLNRAITTRLNGGPHSDREIQVVREKVLADYRAVFEEELILK
jgi:hypothetical protein